jgi:hypothetical protein
MKYVPAKVSRLVGRTRLHINQNSPTILLYAGIAGVVGTTILASRATLKAQPVLEATHLELQEIEYNSTQPGYIRDADPRVQERILRKQRVAVYSKTAVQLGRLYGPVIILGTVSIGCLIKGNQIQNDRYSALGAAYISLQEGFEAYRKRVRDEVGEEKEKDLFYDGQDLTYIEAGPNGPKKNKIRVVGEDGGSIYARFFGPDNPNWKNVPEYNTMFLRQVEAHLNLTLRTRGHVFLNDVYRELGMPDTEEGAVVGWLYERNYGDDQIEFSCFLDKNKDRMYDFMVGNEGEILIDFNVAGPINKLLYMPKVLNPR